MPTVVGGPCDCCGPAGYSSGGASGSGIPFPVGCDPLLLDTPDTIFATFVKTYSGVGSSDVYSQYMDGQVMTLFRHDNLPAGAITYANQYTLIVNTSFGAQCLGINGNIIVHPSFPAPCVMQAVFGSTAFSSCAFAQVKGYFSDNTADPSEFPCGLKNVLIPYPGRPFSATAIWCAWDGFSGQSAGGGVILISE